MATTGQCSSIRGEESIQQGQRCHTKVRVQSMQVHVHCSWIHRCVETSYNMYMCLADWPHANLLLLGTLTPYSVLCLSSRDSETLCARLRLWFRDESLQWALRPTPVLQRARCHCNPSMRKRMTTKPKLSLIAKVRFHSHLLILDPCYRLLYDGCTIL